MTHSTPEPSDDHRSSAHGHEDRRDGQHDGGRPQRLGDAFSPGADGAAGARGGSAAAAPPRGPRGSVAPVEVQHARHLASRVGADRVLVALTLGRPDGGGERAVLRGSDDVLVTVEEMVETVGQGPSTEVLQTARPCAVADLHAATDRWPLLLTTFAPPGPARSLLVVPLLVRDAPPSRTGTAGSDGTAGLDDVGGRQADAGSVAVVGLVVLSRDEPRPFAAPQITAATTGAELIAQVLLSRLAHPGADDDRRHPRRDPPPTGTTEDLAPAAVIDSLLAARAHLVPQAVGLISAQDDVDAVEARRRLHAEAFTAGLTVHEVAERHLRGHR